MKMTLDSLYKDNLKKIKAEIKKKEYYTKVSLAFLPPMIHRRLNWIELRYRYGLLDCFKWEKGIKHTDEHLLLHLLFNNDSLYKSFYEDWEESIEEERDIGKYIMCTMKIPSKWKKDIGLIMKGQYSKLSSKAKELYPLHYNLPGDEKYPTLLESIPHLAITKSGKMIEYINNAFGLDLTMNDFSPEMEMWTIPSEEKETWSEEKILKTKYN